MRERDGAPRQSRRRNATRVAKNVMLPPARRRPRPMPANRSTKPGEPTDSQEMGRILRFEPRRGSQRPHEPPTPPLLGGRSPVESFDKYARGPDDGDDYRYRMRANVAAVVVVGLLIW